MRTALRMSLAVVLAGWTVAVVAPAIGAVEELEQRRPSPQTSLDAVSREVMCPSCDATLDQSSSPAADRMRAWIEARVEAGWTRAEIRAGLVEEYDGNEAVLATPDATAARGRVAWTVPAVIAFGLLLAGVLSLRSWRRAGQVSDGSSSSSPSSNPTSSSSSSASSSARR